MPYLGDYLGQLMSEISIARMHADLETIRLAELYASHPLLRTLPVPHLRLPDVDLDVPVLIQASEAPRAGETARGGAAAADLAKKFDEVLSAHLESAGISLTEAERKKINGELKRQIRRGDLPPEIAVDTQRLANDFSTIAVNALKETGGRGTRTAREIPATLKADLTAAARLEFLKLKKLPPRLSVLVTSKELREAGTAQNMTRLKLKISEQGLEWTSVESDGERQDRLIPE